MVSTGQELLENYLGERPRIIGHVKAVNEVASYIAWRLNEAGVPVDTAFVYGGALLHDIGKLREIRLPDVTSHGEEGYNILIDEEKEMGLQAYADIVRKHQIFCFSNPYLRPRTWEEKIVNYADKLVEEKQIDEERRIYRVIPLGERLDYVKKRYGEDEEKRRQIEESESFLRAIELQLAEKLGKNFLEELAEKENLLSGDMILSEGWLEKKVKKKQN